MDTFAKFAKELIPPVVALIAIAGFGWYVVDLTVTADDAAEVEWGRKLFLLSGVEAIAFAAAGFLFGREVHRARAEQAESDRDRLKETAAAETSKRLAVTEQLARAQTGGRALGVAVRAIGSPGGPPNGGNGKPGFAGGSGGGTAVEISPGVAQAVAIADEFFPA